MTGELIKDRHSSYTPHASQSLDNFMEANANSSFSAADRYSSTLASCNDIPVPIHAAKAIFIETEQEIVAHRQDSKERQKISFFKRLSLDLMKFRFAEFLNRVKDTLANYRASTVDFLRGTNSQKKIEATSKKNEVKKIKNEKTSEKAPVSSLPVDDLEARRIREIENASAFYAEELVKANGSDMNSMIEMACKLAILIGSLGYRYNKKEIKDYMKHLEINVQKRVKTFEGGRTWTYISVGLQAGAAGLSFLSLGAGLPKVGGLFKGLSQTASPLGAFGSATSKLGDIESEKKQGKRTGFEHEGEKMKQVRSDMDRSNEKIHQLMQEMMSAWRSLNQTNTDAIKRAVAG